jgi:hypothetical protein
MTFVFAPGAQIAVLAFFCKLRFLRILLILRDIRLGSFFPPRASPVLLILKDILAFVLAQPPNVVSYVIDSITEHTGNSWMLNSLFSCFHGNSVVMSARLRFLSCGVKHIQILFILTIG